MKKFKLTFLVSLCVMSSVSATEIIRLPVGPGAVMSRNGNFVIGFSPEDPRQPLLFNTQTGATRDLNFSDSCADVLISSVSDEGDLVGLTCFQTDGSSSAAVTSSDRRTLRVSQILESHYQSYSLNSSASGRSMLVIATDSRATNLQAAFLWKTPQGFLSDLGSQIPSRPLYFNPSLISDDGLNLWGVIYDSRNRPGIFNLGPRGFHQFTNGTHLQLTALSPKGEIVYGISYGPRNALIPFRFNQEEGYQEISLINEALPGTAATVIGASEGEERLIAQVQLRGRPEIQCMISERGQPAEDLRLRLIQEGFSDLENKILSCEKLSTDGQSLLALVQNPGTDYSAQEVLIRLDRLCLGDFNQDGGIDGRDADDFYASYESNEFRADVDRNGTLNFHDIEAFMMAFGQGC